MFVFVLLGAGGGCGGVGGAVDGAVVWHFDGGCEGVSWMVGVMRLLG